VTAPRAFLGVEASATGRRWTGPSVEADRLAEAMVQETGLPAALARVLVARGVAPAEAERFLEPQLRDLLPDPRILKDMAAAAGRFVRAVKDREKIAVFADYDVDGGSSAALLITWLRAMGRPATLYIPDRIDEGYGPNVPAMAALAKDHDLILCVDCGTLSHEPIAAAKGADALIICTEWKGFWAPDFDLLRTLLRTPVIFDGRNLYDPALLAQQGFDYMAIGRGVDPERAGALARRRGLPVRAA
jgi:single-stranded-DNA-specific exonuclease